jgi:hypothetical protein
MLTQCFCFVKPGAASIDLEALASQSKLQLDDKDHHQQQRRQLGSYCASDASEHHQEQGAWLELLEEALHWHRYANAIYGWPMYLWSHRHRWVQQWKMRGEIMA